MKVALMAAACLLLALVQARAAVVTLKDGSRLQGRILNASDKELTLETEDGVLHIGSARIQRVDYAPEAPPSGPAAPAQPRVPPPPPPPVPVSTPPPPYSEGPGEFRRGSQLLSMDLGLAIPLSRADFTDAGGGRVIDGEVGPLIGLKYLYQAGPSLGLGLEFQFQSRGSKDSGDLLPLADSVIAGDSELFLGVVRFTLPSRGWVRPYAAAAGGGGRRASFIEATPVPGFAWSDTLTAETRRLYDDHVWGWAYGGRLGADFFNETPVFFGLEAGWLRQEGGGRLRPTRQGRDLGLGERGGRVDAVTISARWGYRF